VLRACRRTLKPGGRLAFYTVFADPSARLSDIKEAMRLRPLSVSWRNVPHTELLRRAGFTRVTESDLTAEFLRVTRLFIEADLRHADALRPLKPPGEFDRDLKAHIDEAPLIERGAMRRSLFVADKPA
jgi:hypothetical protein